MSLKHFFKRGTQIFSKNREEAQILDTLITVGVGSVNLNEKPQMRLIPLTLALCAIAICPAQADVSGLVRSSEQTATSLCLANQRPFHELRLLCQDALEFGQLTHHQNRHASYVLGNALAELGDHAKAREVLTSLLERFPTHTDAREALAWDYWATQELERARVEFQVVIASLPSAESLGGLANILRRLDGDHNGALAAITKALVIDPDYLWALRERGWIEIELGRLAAATQSFEAALSRDPSDALALHGISYAASEAADYEAALSAINQAIALDDRMSWAFSHRAYILRKLNRNAQAVTEAVRAIELNPDGSDGYLQKMMAHRALGQIEEASKSARMAARRGAATGLVRYWHADILSDDAQLSAALSEIEQAIEIEGGRGYYLELKSYILLEMGQHQEAITASKHALSRDPKLSFAAYYGAIASIEMGHQEAGIALIRTAIENDLPKQQYQYFLGLLIGKGLSEKAAYLRALK